jgi:ribonuclease VapC
MAFILDASAVLAVVLAEKGADYVLQHMSETHLGTVNLSEATAKLMEYGVSAKNARDQISRLDSEIHDFDPNLAERTAILRSLTKNFGLSLGDRACLSLGQSLNLPILTSDRRMCESGAILGFDIRLIR